MIRSLSNVEPHEQQHKTPSFGAKFSMIKTITIRDTAYRKLVAVKSEKESFSDLLERLVEEVMDPVDLLRSLRESVELTSAEKRKILRSVRRRRLERRF